MEPYTERYGAALGILREGDVRALQGVARQRIYVKGETVQEPTGGCGGIFAMRAGAVVIFQEAPGREHVSLCHRRQRGHIFVVGRPDRNEMQSELVHVARDDTVLWSVSWFDALRLCRSRARVATVLALVERENEVDREEFIREMRCCDPIARVMHALALMAGETRDNIVWESHREIGWEAGILREVVTKSLPILQRRRLIETWRHQRGISIPDPDRLITEYHIRSGM